MLDGFNQIRQFDTIHWSKNPTGDPTFVWSRKLETHEKPDEALDITPTREGTVDGFSRHWMPFCWGLLKDDNEGRENPG